MTKLLIQTQLSNTPNGKFDLACDSGWQMPMGRVREIFKHRPGVQIDVMCPRTEQCVAGPTEIYPDLWGQYGQGAKANQLGDLPGVLNFVEHHIIPGARETRYDFDWKGISQALGLAEHKVDVANRYDVVYVNDPMQLRALKAVFHVVGGYQPRFVVHNHFIDLPEYPKFDVEMSLWLGQCESALKADYNFWQCGPAMEQFFTAMGKEFVQDVVDDVRAKSMPWDDGYSHSEITSPVNESAMRFAPADWHRLTQGKTVLFLPNRISPSSGDYTRGMKFMFKILPELRQRRQDFVVVAGNPNLKFSNDFLSVLFGDHGYTKLSDDTFNRDEYKFVARHSDVVVALYDEKSDAYGGTSCRECVELGCALLAPDCNEYQEIAHQAQYPYLCKPDLSDIVGVADRLISLVGGAELTERKTALQQVVRDKCSHEMTTTPDALTRLFGC